jgi:uncharacterized protein YecE (DUF72 family)
LASLFDEPSGSSKVFKIGTSGWSYPPNTGPGSWTGIFYPWKKADELKIYSRYFDTVEVNSTFYRPCTPKTAESWIRRTPDHFQFTVKAWQRFTHDKEMWWESDIREFKEGLVPLIEAGKLGCLLFQFPASFRRTPQTQARLSALLNEFTEFRKAVELRHRSWNEEASAADVFPAVPAFIDEPKFEDSIRQEIQPRDGVLYVRLHGRRAEKWWKHEHRNERYDYLYSPAEIHGIAAGLKAVAARNPMESAYVFFNNHPEAKAVANAVMLRVELDDPLDVELPESLTQKYPDIPGASR